MGLNAIPAYARSLNHPEIVLRNIQRGMFGGRSGAMRFGDFAVAPTATTRQFSVGAGRAFIMGRENSSQGGYVVFSDASENLLVTAPAASPRIDTLLLRIYDDQYGTLASGTSRAQWDIIPGVAASSPLARPDSDFLFGGSQYIPGAWWRVADIRSNPGDTTIPANQIYPTLDHVRVPGAETLCLSVPTVTGFGGRPTDPVRNEKIREVDTDLLWRWNGTSWVLAEPYVREVNFPAAAPNAKFSNIPTSLKHLRVTYTARTTASTGGFAQFLTCRINDDAIANYRYALTQMTGGAVTPIAVNSAAFLIAGIIPTGVATASLFGSGWAEFAGWNSPHANYLGETFQSQIIQDGTNYFIASGGGHWSQAGQNSLTFAPDSAFNIAAGSHFLLEGTA